jgi:hypothetical protein
LPNLESKLIPTLELLIPSQLHHRPFDTVLRGLPSYHGSAKNHNPAVPNSIHLPLSLFIIRGTDKF